MPPRATTSLPPSSPRPSAGDAALDERIGRAVAAGIGDLKARLVAGYDLDAALVADAGRPPSTATGMTNESHSDRETGPGEMVPPDPPRRASVRQLRDAVATLGRHGSRCSRDELLAIIQEEGTRRAGVALRLAEEAGQRVATAVPQGAACGRGAVELLGPSVALAWGPQIESPFGQDYDRHVAYTREVVAVLARFGVAARASVELD